MKKLLLILTALLLSAPLLKAQKTVVVQGQIDNPVANQTVWISFFSSPSGCSVIDSTNTDSLGKYSYSFIIGAGCAYNGVRMNMLGCKGVYDTLWNTQYYDSSSTGPDTLKADFKYCDTCKVTAGFIDSVNGKTIKFFNISSGSPNKFKWYFGDTLNSTSTLENPSFTYDSLNKFYWVCFVATDSATGCKDSICKYVKTADTTSPCKNYYAAFSDTVIGSTVDFFNNSSSSTSFYWDFGDTSTSSSMAYITSHTYASAGTYTVCLIAQNNIQGCADTTCKSITVGTNQCSGFAAAFSDSVNGYYLTATDLSSSNANRRIWNFGDGSPYSYQSTGTTVSHTYNNANSFNLCLIAQDTLKGCRDTVCKTIITGSNCNGFAASFMSNVPHDTAFLYNTSTNNIMGSNIYKWTFGDGDSSSLQNPQHIYASPGNYTICLTATDTVRGCTNTTCKNITVSGGSNPCAGFSAGFSDSVNGYYLTATDLSSSSANRRIWSYGDGSPYSYQSTNTTVSHTYNNAGNFNLCLIAQDTLKGCQDTVCKTVIIGSNCNGFSASFLSNVPHDTAFLYNSSTNNNTGSNIYKWTFGDGDSSSLQNPQHIYASPGNYTICLTATDTVRGCTNTTCKNITVSGGSNPCAGFSAGFSDSTTNNYTFSFVGAAFTSSNANKFFWRFGDGFTSSAANPTHTYGVSGNYTVCLYARDTTNNCFDSTCKTISVTVPPCSNFNASFTEYVRWDTATFWGNVSGTAHVISWDFGDGQTSSNLNPTHIYATPGNYNVCFAALDTINWCADTTCKTIKIDTACYNFNAGFTFTLDCDTLKTTNFSSSSANKFNWTFGNSASSTLPSPTYVYPNTGGYMVCLTAEDTINGCIDTTCQFLKINSSLQGTIYRNNNQLADSGRVWLIQISLDSLSGDTILTAIDSVTFVSPNATYNFGYVPTGNYLIKAALLPGAAFYNNRLPTYYVQETRWDKATLVNVNKPCVTADIVLKAGNNPGGSGFVGGLVTQGANKVGDPLERILVLLYNSDGSPFGFTYTDENGEYLFDNIAYGDYTVVVDLLGKPSDEYTVTVDANNPSDYNGNFEVNSTDVTLMKNSTGIVKLSKGTLRLYPNPAATDVTAVFKANSNGSAIVTISDMTGKTVYTETVNALEGLNSTTINVGQLKQGLYIINISTDTNFYTERLGVKN